MLTTKLVILRRFTSGTPKIEPSTATYKCTAKDCGWQCNATRITDGMLRLRVTQRLHTCTGGVGKHASASSKSWLNEAVSGHFRVIKTTKVSEIQDIISIHFAERVSYRIAHLC